MANWAGIAGGAADGILRGRDDLRQQELFRQQNEQYQRQKKQQDIDDVAAAKIAGIRTPGEYEDTTEGPIAEGDLTGVPTKTKSKVTQSQYQRNVANAYGATPGRENMVASMNMNALANQQQQTERTLNIQQQQDTILQIAKVNLVDPMKALKLAAVEYAKHPDGGQIVVDRSGPEPMFYVIDEETGKPIMQPQPITDANVGKLLRHAMDLTSIEQDTAAQDRGIKKQGADAVTSQAVSAGKHADSAAALVPIRRQEVENTGTYQKGVVENAAEHNRINKLHNDNTAAIAGSELAIKGRLADSHIKLEGRHGDYYGALGDKTKETPSQAMKARIDAYTDALIAENPHLTPQQARKHATAVAMKDPDAKPTPGVGMAEAGLFQLPGDKRVYKMGPKGPEEVLMPQDLKALGAGIAGKLGEKGKGDKAAAEPSASARTSGNHGPQSKAYGNGSELDDVNMRLGLQGISEETRAALMQRRAVLARQRNQSMGIPIPSDGVGDVMSRYKN